VNVAVEESLASISNDLVYSAMAVYTAALGAFALDLAGRGAAARPTGAAPAAQPAAAPVAQRVAVPVAAGGGAPAGPVVATAGEKPAGEKTLGAAAPGGAGAPDGGAGSVAVDGAGSATSRGRWANAGGIAVALTWLAFLLHLAAVTARGLSAGRAPWGNMYEFSTAGAVVVVGVFLVVLRTRDIRYLGTFVVGPVLLTLGLAITVLYTPSAQLVPALQSFWLVIHVSVAFIASALFTLGFSTSVLQLVQQRREEARAAGTIPRRGRFMDALPAAADLERSAYRLHVVAFPLWTFTVIAGAIWAEHAWGRYWNWDPKEVWSFVIWVVYAGYLHARSTRGWDGRRAAWFAIAGYGCVLFNFLVVNIFFVGFHSYSGV
jgi:cytochrome c-type biogenesis protein CcsB